MFSVKSVDTGCELLFLKTLNYFLVVATKVYTLAFFFFLRIGINIINFYFFDQL